MSGAAVHLWLPYFFKNERRQKYVSKEIKVQGFLWK